MKCKETRENSNLMQEKIRTCIETQKYLNTNYLFRINTKKYEETWIKGKKL